MRTWEMLCVSTTRKKIPLGFSFQCASAPKTEEGYPGFDGPVSIYATREGPDTFRDSHFSPCVNSSTATPLRYVPTEQGYPFSLALPYVQKTLFLPWYYCTASSIYVPYHTTFHYQQQKNSIGHATLSP